MKQIYLYGIAGVEKQYAVIRYTRIEEDSISIQNIVYCSTMLKIKNPDIEHVYAVDDRRGLAWDYRDAIKSNSLEGFAIFKDILEREGILVI